MKITGSGSGAGGGVLLPQARRKTRSIRPQPYRDCTAFCAKDVEDVVVKIGNDSVFQADEFQDKIKDEILWTKEQQNAPISTTHEIPEYNCISNAACISNIAVEKRTPQRREFKLSCLQSQLQDCKKAM